MKIFFRKIFVLFALLGLILSAGVLEKEVIFNTNEISFKQLNGYDLVDLKGCGMTEDVSYPLLPKASFSLIIPQGAKITNIEVVSEEKEEISGKYKIYPTQQPQPFLKDKIFSFVEGNKDIYAQDTPYPDKIIEPSHSGLMGGYNIASLFIYPLQYIPNQKKLILYSKIKFKVTYEENLRPPRIVRTQKQKNIFKERIKNLVLNPEDIEIFEPLISLSRSRVLPADTVEYVIITAPFLKESFEILADWKTKKGIPARVVTLDSIYANYTGVDNAEKIRNFIKDANSSWGTNWILLGGQCDYESGQEIVPRRDVWYKGGGGELYPDEDTIPSDLYFSDLDGNWNADGDETYGEATDAVDLYSDVFVGRAPVRTVAQAENFVNKIFNYEKRPSIGYQKKILLPTAYLAPGDYDERLSQEAIANIVPSDWQVSRLYERAGNLTHQAFVDSLRSGFGFVHLVGHGMPDRINTYYKDEYLTSNDLQTLNNSNSLGIHNSMSCMLGAVDYIPNGDCIAEYYLTPANGVGFSIMNSRYGWGLPHLKIMGPSEVIDTSFYHEIFKEEYPNHDHLGVAHAFSKDGYISQVTWSSYWAWCIYELNLFGDPELPLWTDIPKNLTVTHESEINMGRDSFSINVTDGASSVENATVCLFKEGDLYKKGYTDASGNLTLDISPGPKSVGIMFCTVTKHNYLPYENIVSVVLPSLPWIILDNYNVIDISGDDDGKIDPGENIDLSITVKNASPDTGFSITSTLRTTDPYVTIIDSVVNFGNIMPNSLANSLDNFNIEITPDCPIDNIIDFIFISEDIYNSSWIDELSIPILTPEISIYPDALFFDTTLIGFSDTLHVNIDNIGTDTLFINNIISDNVLYSLDYNNTLPIKIPPVPYDTGFIVNVIYTPVSPGESTGNLNVYNNDSDEPNITIHLQGIGLAPGEIYVYPDSLSDTLSIGEISNRFLKIFNNGLSDILFDISFNNSENLSDIYLNSRNFLNDEFLNTATFTDKKRFRNTPTRNIDILLLKSGNEPSNIQSILLNFPNINSVDIFDVSSKTPTLNELFNYDCVIVMNEYEFYDPVGIGDVLADYADIGGGVILSLKSFDFDYGIQGRFFNDGYMPFNLTHTIVNTFGICLDTMTIIHPITKGFHSAILRTYGNTNISTGSELVAELNVNEESTKIPFIATKYKKIVGLNIYLSDQSSWAGDIPLILHNSALWSSSINPWLYIEDTNGIIPPTDSVNVELYYNAKNLNAGNYFTHITISSNDPINPQVEIPTHLHAISAPDIAISYDTLNYDTVFIGNSTVKKLIIANIGTENLNVSNISFDNSDYISDTTNFILAPRTTQTVSITFTPSVLGSDVGTLNISSNDSYQPNIMVSLLGNGVIPPDIMISQDSLIEDLFIDKITTCSLTVNNNGGSDLIINISIEPTDTSVANILILGAADESYLNDVVDYLTNSGQFNSVSKINGSLYTPTLADLQTFDAVGVFSWDKWSNSSAIGNVIADYIELGGNVCIASAANATGYNPNGMETLIGGRFKSKNYWLIFPFDYSHGNGKTFTIGKVLETAHPIMSNVNTFKCGTKLYYGASINPNSTLIAEFNDGTPLVVLDNLKESRRADLSFPFFTNAVDQTGIDTTTDARLLVSNILEWLAGVPWIYTDSTSAIIPAGESFNLEVTFNATNLIIGKYLANLSITTNNPISPKLDVSLQLNVTEYEIPIAFSLSQNYPNPFSNQTTIDYACPKRSNILIEIFDIMGRQIKTLVDKEVEAGYHKINWDGSDKYGRKVANSVYFYRITAEKDYLQTKKMVFLK